MTERIGGDQSGRVKRDHQMDHLVSDYLQSIGLGASEFVVQSGSIGRDYGIRIRFPRLKKKTADGSQYMQVTVEHRYEDGAVVLLERRIIWAMEVCADTLPLAHKEYTSRGGLWPRNYPLPQYIEKHFVSD